MTENELLAAWRKRLKDEVLKDFYHPTDTSRGREQEFKAPYVVDGWLPPKRSGNEQDVPYVIVRPSEGDTEEEDGRIQDLFTSKLLIGSYGEGQHDHQYAMNIFTRIREDLRRRPTLKNAAGVNAWKCRPKIKWKMPDEQAITVFFIEALVVWEMPTPQEVLEDDGYVI